jgi:hypothetical protein
LGERRVGTEDEEEEREKRDVGDKSQDIFLFVCPVGWSIDWEQREWGK